MASDDEYDGYYYYYYDDDNEIMEEGGEEDDVEETAFVEVLEQARPESDHRVDYWAITVDSLCAAQQQDLSAVMNLLNLKAHQARVLLIHHRWKLDRIYDHFDRKGLDRLLLEAGIVLQENKGVIGSIPSKSVTCNVCFEDFSPSAVSTMDCGHCFCNDCWTEYFFARVDCGNRQIRCMEVKCPVICDENIVKHLLSKSYPDAAKRFEHFLLESFLEDNDSVKWCPSTPHCGNAIRVNGDPYCEVECPCGLRFCFNCLGKTHSPCPCPMWDLWTQKCSNESENVNWILANTKNCPKCYKPIVKDGGCNLVTCKCGQSLCWLCGAATGSSHGWNYINGHSCNRFSKEDKRKIDNGRRQLHRYTHYYNRFKGHGDSYDAEKKLENEINAMIKQPEKKFQSLLMDDGSWMRRAHKSLVNSRLALSHSYVFAYYMFDWELQTCNLEDKYKAAKQNLFEDQQEQLEGNVERLSKLLSKNVPTLEDEIFYVKQQAVNISSIVGRLCTEMYKSIQDELLPVLRESMFIAPYRPDGIVRAKEFPDC